MSIPLPPGHKATTIPTSDISIILSTTLWPQHREDPNILRFINAYLVSRDLRQVAAETGLSYRDCQSLKRRPDIYEAINKITDLALNKYGYDAHDVVQKVIEVANVDIAEFENADGTYKEKLSELSPETRRAVRKFKVKNCYDTDPNGMRVVSGRIIEVELWDKMKAVELLGREKNIFKENKKIEHSISDNMASVLLESRKRAEDRLLEMRDVAPPVALPEPEDDSE
jgi:hypothetical protein